MLAVAEAGPPAALGELVGRLLPALAVNAAAGALAYAARGVDRSGLAAGLAVGVAIFAAIGWSGWTLLAAFFVLASASTRAGALRKQRRAIAQEKGGRRSARNVLAKGAVPAACALLAAVSPLAEVLVTAFAAALAAAAGDTAASEIGKAWGGRTVLARDLRPVAPGTEGGISLLGTAAGVVVAAAVAAMGLAVGLYGWFGLVAVAAAAVVAGAVESLVGATLQRRGLLGNEGANLLNTLVAAVLAGGWALAR